MYSVPKIYPNPYHANVNRTNSHPDNVSRNVYGQDLQLETILSGITKEASAIEFYRRLANAAGDQKNKKDILQTLESRKSHLHHFTQLYMNITGRQPEYQIKKIPFHTFREGLQKGYEAEVESYHEYHRSISQTHDPNIRNVFLWALQGEQENASRIHSLHEEDVRQVPDYGTEPFVVDIEQVTKQNNTFRTALWTGEHLQVTLMSIGVDEDIGLEVHPNLDQFLRIEEGQGLVQMGESKEQLNFQAEVMDDFAILIPAGTWHNLTNTGNKPIKLYSIYSPPEHPYGTVHETKAIAMAAEEDHHH